MLKSWLPSKIVPCLNMMMKKPKPLPIFELSFSNTFPNSIFFAAPRNSWVRNCYVKCVIKIPIFWFSFEIFERLIKYVLKPSVAQNSTYYDWLGGVYRLSDFLFILPHFSATHSHFANKVLVTQLLVSSSGEVGSKLRKNKYQQQHQQLLPIGELRAAEINFITIANCLWRRSDKNDPSTDDDHGR